MDIKWKRLKAGQYEATESGTYLGYVERQGRRWEVCPEGQEPQTERTLGAAKSLFEYMVANPPPPPQKRMRPSPGPFGGPGVGRAYPAEES
jgi:hypothetical protein